MRFAALLCVSIACTATDLEHRIDLVTGASTLRASVGIDVVELSSGKTLYHLNENRLFLPASNMKLFTSALALLRLGPDRKFTTQVVLDSSGNLVLVGGGDPSLSGRVFPYQKGAAFDPALKPIDDLAVQVAASGITRIRGDVVGDDRLYPWAPYAPSWTEDDTLRDYGAPVSALTVNENVLSITIRGGEHAGDAATLSLDPALEYYEIDQRVATVVRGGEAKIRISRQPGSRQLLIWGSIPASRSVTETVAIDDPALYSACALYEALTRRGVVIEGRPVARHRGAMDDYAPVDGKVVALRTSPPLGYLLQVMDKVSQNLFAELMLRETGRAMRNTGTREAGLDELNSLLIEIGAAKDDSRFEDGSGLSRNALVTPRLMTKLLVFLSQSQYREQWLSLLPVGGQDGTLEHRLCCVVDGHGIFAKTGSLSRALALSGYADSKTHGRVAFSILVNDFTAPSSEVRAWIDKIATALLE
jgi:serine-type D-Ala-D-Ala carboxypeptidase/endopeptidase (penicillin-binding protein 4)